MKMKQTTGFWKFSGSIVGLVALLAILVAINMMIGTLKLRKDLTEDKIYTLSNGTRAILKKLDSPVTLKFFFTTSSPKVPMGIKHFGQKVEDLLDEYQIAGGRNIIIEKYNPKPDSDAEEWAQRYGLTGQSLGMMGPTIYLGLVAVKGDNHNAIPFLNPRKEALLEYDITRMITRVAFPKRPVLGISSSLPVMGVQASPFVMPGQPRPISQPAWIAFQELSADYDIRMLSSGLDRIDDDIDIVIVVHPKNLPDKALYTLDQFVLRGGNLIAFVDPLCLTDAILSRHVQSASPVKPSSDLVQLTDAWGLTYDPGKVLADISLSTPVIEKDDKAEDSPVFLTLRDPNINSKEVITSQLETMIMACAGTFAGTGSEFLNVTPLLMSSEQSQLINSMAIEMGSEEIRRDFQSGYERLNLAVRLHGRFKTAFPDGKPKAESEADKSNDDNKTGKEKKEEPADDTVSLRESVEPATVIIIGDVDMLYDQFTVQELSFFGQRAFQPINDNMNFLANAVDQLSGGADLAEIRSRGRFDRPFDRVLALQRKAQERWLMREQALQEKLETTRERLEALQAEKDKSQRFILSAEQQQEIERFKQEELKTQRELKQVRKNLREGIEQLGVKVKAVNIILMPVIICIAGLAFALYRRIKVTARLET